MSRAKKPGGARLNREPPSRRTPANLALQAGAPYHLTGGDCRRIQRRGNIRRCKVLWNGLWRVLVIHLQQTLLSHFQPAAILWKPPDRLFFSLVHRAAARPEENTQHALGMAHKFSLQLLEAQERIATLEAEVGCSR